VSSVPGVPVFLIGHSIGAIAAALAIMEDPTSFTGAVLTGSLLSPVPWVLNLVQAGDDATFELELSMLSSDPLYLDEIENDQLAFSTDEGAKSLARIIPPAWEAIAHGFGDVELPILFLQGEVDVLGPVGIARSWANRLAKAKMVVFEGQQHDILNESVHANVAKEIIAFVESHR